MRLQPEWDFPGFESTVRVHEWEIRADVTVITPRLVGHTAWEVKDLAALVQARPRCGRGGVRRLSGHQRTSAASHGRRPPHRPYHRPAASRSGGRDGRCGWA
ncbi:hypothetical protein [Demequina litorisediminis]|uniref:hypothetical protein n=1 Tax=Demequina litorisediminis TaxID=1849022 RepID=UPI0024E0B923|nr:hypothetical protein [Demequina litorisediminis]